MAYITSANQFVLFVLLLTTTALLKKAFALKELPEHDRLYFVGLANKYGLYCEEHDVLTEDGYILKLFHIPGDQARPVLLMHGVLDSADTFMVRGNTSMVVALTRAGYDVWVGNKRGNRYSRRHVNLDPNNDKKFWDFSFHEIGYYDLPANIDYILNKTGQTKLSCMGHSQGNTIFYVLGSMRPEYNDKIKLMIALAPICFLHHLPNPAMLVVQISPLVNDILQTVGYEEIFGDNSIENNILKTLCRHRDSYQICRKAMFSFAGYDPEEFESEILATVASHYPAGTSRKGGAHLLQLGLRKNFSQMDYGIVKNLAAYNSTVPPNYDLSKVTMKVALLAGANDKMCALTDVKILRSRLPNVVEYHLMEWSKFNHIDYVWGRNMGKHLFPKVLSLLNQFSDS